MIKKIIKKIVTGAAVVASAVFYVLFRSNKDRYEKLQKENLQKEAAEAKQEAEEAQKAVAVEKAAAEVEVKEKENNEKIRQKAYSGNSLSSHNALIDGLRK